MSVININIDINDVKELKKVTVKIYFFNWLIATRITYFLHGIKVQQNKKH